VEDVAEAVVRSLDAPDSDVVYELGGPRVYTYKELLASVGEHIGSRPLLLPLPFALWRPLAFAAEMLPTPPITRNQVELMETDNIASAKYPGFDALGIRPRGIEEELASTRGL
jgi:NADH dehydrogenase